MIVPPGSQFAYVLGRKMNNIGPKGIIRYDSINDHWDFNYAEFPNAIKELMEACMTYDEENNEIWLVGGSS